MSLYRSFAGGPTSCVRCSEVIHPHWRDFAAHSAAHGRRDQLVARAARVKAMRDQHACASTELSAEQSGATGKIEEQRRTAQRAKRRTVLSTPDRPNRKESA